MLFEVLSDPGVAPAPAGCQFVKLNATICNGEAELSLEEGVGEPLASSGDHLHWLYLAVEVETLHHT